MTAEPTIASDAKTSIFNMYSSGSGEVTVLHGSEGLQKPEIKIFSIDEHALFDCLSGVINARAPSPTAYRSSRTNLDGDRFDSQGSFSTLNNIMRPIGEWIFSRTEPEETIWIIPHRVFHRVPFQTVTIDGYPLGLRNPIVYSPNVMTMRYCVEKRQHYNNDRRSCLIVSCPRNQDGEFTRRSFEHEISSVEKILRDHEINKLTNLEATKTAIITSLANADIFHFTGHGFFDEIDPLSSGLLVSDGNTLPRKTVREIRQNPFTLSAFDLLDASCKADLVFLAACVTGVSKREAGDEQLGLARSFLYAGASSLITSLWPVHTEATEKWVEAFYLAYNVNSATKAQSWLSACRQVHDAKSKDMSHPWYWAPFSLIGDWN